MPEVRAGFLIVQAFEALYTDFAIRFKDSWPFYAIPRSSVPASRMVKKYRGLDRNPLIGIEPGSPIDLWWQEQGQTILTEPASQKALWELEAHAQADQGIIFSVTDARQIYSLLKEPLKRDIIWVKDCSAPVDRTGVGTTLGYEPTWFPAGQFSALCDGMCFPRWHGTDKGGTIFREFFGRLNEHALFDSPEDAADFLEFYRSHDWTESGDYVMTEVCLPEE